MHTTASQLHNRQLTNASLCAYIHRPPPASNRHPDTHDTNTPPPIPLPVPSSMLGLVQARNHPPRQPTTPRSPSLQLSSQLRGSGPPPLLLPPVDSGNGLRVLTLSFQTRFPAGLPVPVPPSAFHLCLWPCHCPNLTQQPPPTRKACAQAWPASSPPLPQPESPPSDSCYPFICHHPAF